MASVLVRHWVGRLLTCVVLGMVLTGCASFNSKDTYWGSRLGLRPDEPAISALMNAEPCGRFTMYTQYAKNLEEAYRTRGTQNRAWIYVAGLTGLGVTAASGALAAATAVTVGTLALLSISGGFTAGAFATINNSQLANVYNDAAQEIGTARATAEAQVFGTPSQPPLNATCAASLATLIQVVSQARNKLDTARTDSAEGALIRATAGSMALKEIIARQTAADVTSVTFNGEITKINNIAAPFQVPTGGMLVPLTVTHVQLDKEAPADIKIVCGTKVFDMATTFPTKKGSYEYDVMWQIPATPPDGAAVKSYAPALLVGKNRKRIPAAAWLTINYP